MIVSCGEALIDFLPVKDAAGNNSYQPKVGGSPYNVALTAGRLGNHTGFLGGISTDFFGEMLVEELKRSLVSLKYVGFSARPPRSPSSACCMTSRNTPSSTRILPDACTIRPRMSRSATRSRRSTLVRSR